MDVWRPEDRRLTIPSSSGTQIVVCSSKHPVAPEKMVLAVMPDVLSQLVPQIWTNWRTKKTDGLPSSMMFLWALCSYTSESPAQPTPGPTQTLTHSLTLFRPRRRPVWRIRHCAALQHAASGAAPDLHGLMSRELGPDSGIWQVRRHRVSALLQPYLFRTLTIAARRHWVAWKAAAVAVGVACAFAAVEAGLILTLRVCVLFPMYDPGLRVPSRTCADACGPAAHRQRRRDGRQGGRHRGCRHLGRRDPTPVRRAVEEAGESDRHQLGMPHPACM